MMGREQRANAQRREAIGKVADKIAGHFVDRGRIIELGFAAMIEQSYPGWKTMSAEQRDQLRTAFFAGAQHLFGSIMGMLEPGTEPTEKDLRRMDMIAHELSAFIEEYKQRNGITDPDIGPEEQTKQ
jgi:hypothetical protein